MPYSTLSDVRLTYSPVNTVGVASMCAYSPVLMPANQSSFSCGHTQCVITVY